MSEINDEYVEEVEQFLEKYLKNLIKRERRETWNIYCDHDEERNEIYCKSLTDGKDGDPSLCWDCSMKSRKCKYGKISIKYVTVCDEFSDHDTSIIVKIKLKEEK